MSVADADARAAEEMADSLLRDSPTPKTEEEERGHEKIPTGNLMMPFSSDFGFSIGLSFLPKISP